MLNFSKPMLLTQTVSGKEQLFSLADTAVSFAKTFGYFFVQYGPNYWRVDLNGVVEGHGMWKVINKPEPPVVHKATVMWYRLLSGEIAVCAYNSATQIQNARDFYNVHSRYVGEQEIEFTEPPCG